MCTSQLTVELDFIPLLPDYDVYSDDPKDLEDTWLSFQNIASLFKLDDSSYRNFFVSLASPMWYNLKDDTTRWKRERAIEQIVMGQRYNAAAGVKYRGSYINEEYGPRRYWFHTFGVVQRDLDLDDPAIQVQLFEGALC